MKQPLKTRGNELSGKAMLTLVFPYCILAFLWTLVLSAVPALEDQFWLAVLPIVISFWVILLAASLNAYRVTLTEAAVTLSWLGIPLRRLSADQLQLFCLAGEEDPTLCLTSLSIQELAALEQRLMLRSPFAKHELPFLKRHANWQERLAGKYLERIRNSPLGFFRDSRVVYLFPDPVVQYQIRALYPQLPYKNLAGLKSYSSDPCLDKTAVPNFTSFTVFFAELQGNTVLLRNRKESVWAFPLEKVKTVVRLDVFRYEKYAPRHTRALMVSTFTAEEMAQKVTDPADEPFLRAYRWAEKAARSWTVRDTALCNLPCTPEMADYLRTHCPDAQWIDLTDSWLGEHVPPTP